MFSPLTKRPKQSSRNDRTPHHRVAPPDSPATHNRESAQRDSFISDRPATGTPARLGVLVCLVSPVNNGEKGDDTNQLKPVFFGEFPQLVRDEQTCFLRNNSPLVRDVNVSGGMDKETCLSWFIIGTKLFVWSQLTTFTIKKLVSAVSWDQSAGAASRARSPVDSSVSVPKITRGVVYWSDLFSGQEVAPVTNLGSSDETGAYSSPKVRKSSAFVIAMACSSSGGLWQFTCSPTDVTSSQVHLDVSSSSMSEGYPRSLLWQFSQGLSTQSCCYFESILRKGLHCFTIEPDLTVLEVWRHEIVGTDGDSSIKKDIASQKQIWPLDLQVDDQGKVITVLVATICMDRFSSSSYTQYSLLTLQHKSETRFSDGREEWVPEKQGPIQVIIPKARVEDKEFLFSMKLRVGGRPQGLAIILSGDGTATVCYFHGNSSRLYKFDLPYDAGKVLDASVLSSDDEHECGAWTVLTEKAGEWAIPEKAVVLGGVEPPERSLLRKGSSNERSRDETRNTPYGVTRLLLEWIDSDLQNSKDQGNAKMGIFRQTARDEESEALLGQLFEEFLLSGKVDGSLGKLSESDGETNVFARKSKSIVDTLAKHWTSTRGAEIVAMTVISAQLVEKQQKHEQFLNFLALSKCHVELCSKQKLQKLINQSHSGRFGSPNAAAEDQVSCALWDLIQFVGERARRNTVLLMDRDNAEVFYSKVSEIEEVFHCLNRQLEYLIRAEQPLGIQVQRACELSNVSSVVVSTAKMEQEKENKALLDEYWTRRDTIFDCLYQQAKEFMEADFQSVKERTDIFRNRCSDLLSVAKRHAGYKIMWKICYDLNDTGLLKNLMHEGVGPQGGFGYFVFQQLYDMTQFSMLLRLGEGFQDELLIFLKRHSDLMWLHEVFLHQFPSASDTLHALALAQDEESMKAIEEGRVSETEDVQPTFAERKRFLNLSKIAYVADKDADSKSKMKRIEADLKLLKLQELIEICLSVQGQWTAVKAFEVFAWTSCSFRENHKSLLEECLRNAADQDDWDRLHQASTNEALFQASKRCYGPNRVNDFDGDFAQVLPLRRENPVDKTSSVEDVLISHKDFAEVGETNANCNHAGLCRRRYRSRRSLISNGVIALHLSDVCISVVNDVEGMPLISK
ncbi:hypothetical protein Bca4012_076269 [Brassica carinata]|uniref:Nuclear pore complex protein NUP133 n=1 Tax=Brassica carinata TaxID=52824 RepID=A0A8X7U7W9_BRACI|nr:hypothetical protein Bca52824_073365 [Brassica carinata]